MKNNQANNQACLQVIRAWRNQAMRHITWTHGVNIAWLHRRVVADMAQPSYIESQHTAAEIFTKALTSVVTCLRVNALVQSAEPSSNIGSAIVPACLVSAGLAAGHGATLLGDLLFKRPENNYFNMASDYWPG